jgi:DivIVA domain-containing protein
MNPEEIQSRDFLVGLRGYDKDEVRSFLAEVAAEHASLLAAIESSQTNVAQLTEAAAAAPAPAAATDDFENLGASVAAILRTAKESAGEITGDAAHRANELRAEAERYAEEVRQRAEELRAQAANEADEVRRSAQATAEELRAAAQSSLDEARAEADRILREANERVAQLEIEAEARVNNRIDEATRREAALRNRLQEANEELQLALMALGDPIAAEHVDVREDVQQSFESHEGGEHDEHHEDEPSWAS